MQGLQSRGEAKVDHECTGGNLQPDDPKHRGRRQPQAPVTAVPPKHHHHRRGY